MRNATWIFILLASLAAGHCVAGTTKSASESLDQGLQAYAAGNYQETATLLDGLTEIGLDEAQRPKLIFWRAQAHLQLKEYQRAQDGFEALVRNYPDFSLVDAAALSVADCDAALKNEDAALKGYQKLYQDPPSSVAPQALWQAAELQEGLGQVVEAKRLLQQLLTRYPDSFEASSAKQRLADLAVLPTLTPTPVPLAVVPKNPAKTVKAHFTIQVGAYANRTGALKLYKRLKKSGYPVRLGKRALADSVFHVVQVGRYSSKALALKTSTRLHNKEKLPISIVETP